VILWGDFVKEKGKRGQATFFPIQEIAIPWPQRHPAGGLDESSPYNREKRELSPFSFALMSQPA